MLVTGVFLAVTAMAQKPRVHHGGRVVHHRTNHNYNVIKISRAKSKIVCPIFEDTGYPYHGLGIKLGDPFAVTYKYYANKHFSFGIDFGKAASGLYSGYYSTQFEQYTDPDTLDFDQSVEYISHKVNSDWVGEVRVLYHIKVDKISPGLRTYAGLGWEFRNTDLTYNFFINDGIIENEISSITRSWFTYGVEGTVGIEYSYFTLPVSAFMELEFYYDLLNDPGYYRIQGGVGLRYIF